MRYQVESIDVPRSAEAKHAMFAADLIETPLAARRRFCRGMSLSGSQLKLLLDNIPQGMSLNKIVYSRTGEPQDFIIIEANKAYLQILELPRKAVINKKAAKKFPIKILRSGTWLGFYNEAVSSGKPQVFEAFFKDKFYMVYVYRMLENFCISVFIDITAQKEQVKQEAQRQQMTAQLKENLERYQYFVKYAPVGICEIDAQTGKFRMANEEMCKILGYREQELLSQALSDFIYPRGNKRFSQRLKDMLAGKEVDESEEYRIKKKSGGSLWAVLQVKLIYTPHGLNGALVVVHDVTKRKRFERALLLAEKRYRRLYETTQDGITARDLEGNMIDCNPAYAKMLGYTRKELRKISVTQLLPEKWHEQRDRIVKKVIQTGRSIVFELEYKRKNGSVFPASVRTWRLTDGKGKVIGTWSLVRDIDQQKLLQKNLEEHVGILEKIIADREKMLKENERLVAIGHTAAMVGHDLRNPLQTLTGELYLLKMEVDALPEGAQKKNLQESIHVIEDQVVYMDKIVSDLQAFVRPVNIDKKPISLQELITTVLKTVIIPENITVQVHNSGDLFEVKADPQLLKRVLINLLTNAVQAMPHGGNLTIATHIDSSGLVSISVKDTGLGIPEKIRSQIFTPLFTTKPRGQGFGLAVCKRVIEAHGGTITYESVEGKGTEFVIKLPSS